MRPRAVRRRSLHALVPFGLGLQDAPMPVRAAAMEANAEVFAVIGLILGGIQVCCLCLGFRPVRGPGRHDAAVLEASD
jgi:hypothetical protein